MGLLTAMIRSPVSGSLPTKGWMVRVEMASWTSGVLGDVAAHVP